MNVAVTARTAGTRHAQRDRRPAADHASRQDVQPGPPASSSRSATTGATAPMWSRRCAVRSMPQAQRMPGRAIGVQWFSIDRKAQTLALDMQLPPLQRPNTTLRVPVKVNGPCRRRRGAHRGRGRRCRHPQSHQLQAAGAGRLLSRPAPAHRRNPRSLRPTDRRHAGHARTDPHRRRRGGGRAARQPADADAARALFRARHGRRRRHRRSRVRHPGLCRHRARDGGGLEQGQGRQAPAATSSCAIRSCSPRRCRASCSPATSGTMHLDLDNVEGAAGDYASPSAPRAPSRSATARRRRCRCAPSSATASPCRCNARAQDRRPSMCAITGPGGFALERSYALDVKPATQVLARRTVKPLAKGESLTLSSDMFADLVPGTGAVSALGRRLDRARCGGAAQGARPLSVRLLRADHQPRAAAALRQRACERSASRARRRGRPAHPRCHRSRCWRGRVRTARSACGRVGGDDAWLDAYVDRLPDARARTRLRRAGRRVQAGARPSAQLRRQRAGASKDGGRDLAYALYVLARNGARRSAICATSPTPSSTISATPDRQGADRRGARPARRPRPRRARLYRRARRSRAAAARRSCSAAPITARRCATRRRW